MHSIGLYSKSHLAGHVALRDRKAVLFNNKIVSILEKNEPCPVVEIGSCSLNGPNLWRPADTKHHQVPTANTLI